MSDLQGMLDNGALVRRAVTVRGKRYEALDKLTSEQVRDIPPRNLAALDTGGYVEALKKPHIVGSGENASVKKKRRRKTATS